MPNNPIPARYVLYGVSCQFIALVLFLTGAFTVALIVSAFGIGLLTVVFMRMLTNKAPQQLSGDQSAITGNNVKDTLAMSRGWRMFKIIYWVAFVGLFIVLMIRSSASEASSDDFPHIPILTEGAALLSYLIPAFILYFIIKFLTKLIVKKKAIEK